MSNIDINILTKIVSYINDSSTLLRFRINKDMDKFIMQNKDLWDSICMYETKHNIESAIHYGKEKRSSYNKDERNYGIIYFSAIKSNNDMSAHFLNHKLDIFQEKYGKLDKNLYCDIRYNNKRYVFTKLKKYENYINKGVSVKLINKFSYKKGEEILSIMLIISIISGIVITAPISVPVCCICGVYLLKIAGMVSN